MPPKFEQAYDEHLEQVYGYLAYRVGIRADAEDLTQVTFERAYRAWARFDSRRGSLITWLLAIARNALIDHARRERPLAATRVSQDELSETELQSEMGPESERLGLSPELEAAMGRLRRRDREVLALRFGADLRAPEIAEMLGLTVANVQQILSRTLRRLRGHLESTSGAQTASPTRAAER